MFKVGDKVRVTRDWDHAKAGMEGEVVCPETDRHEPFIRFPGWARGHDGARRWAGQLNILPEGSTEGHFIHNSCLELIPTEQEKPVEQVYEVGGTLTDARSTVRKIEDVLADGRVGVLINEKHIVYVFPDHYIYTPPVKPVPMTRELQEAIEAMSDMLPAHHRMREIYDLCCAVRNAYQKAKESAK